MQLATHQCSLGYELVVSDLFLSDHQLDSITACPSTDLLEMWRGRTVEHCRSEVKSSTYRKTIEPKATLLCSHKNIAQNLFSYILFCLFFNWGEVKYWLSVAQNLLLQCFTDVPKSILAYSLLLSCPLSLSLSLVCTPPPPPHTHTHPKCN